MENGDQFFDELSAVKVAVNLKKKHFQVEFIPEGSEKRPDILARSPKNPDTPCVLEVKHLSGESTIGIIFDEVRKIPSPYSVEVRAKDFQLASQVRHLASVVATEIRRLQEEAAKPPRSEPDVLKVFDSNVSIYIDPHKANSGGTGVYVFWSFEEEFENTADRLTSVMNKARDQLNAYRPDAVNMIVLDVEKASLHDDEIEDTLRWKPRLFALEEYRKIAGVEFVSNIIPPKDALFANSNNEYVKSGVLQSLGLSANIKVIAYPSIPIDSLPISQGRREKIIVEFREEFLLQAVARRFLKVVAWKSDSTLEPVKLTKFVIDEILDKIWFVDDPPDADGQFSVHGIGAGWGQAMAKAETKTVVERLIEVSSKLPAPSNQESFSPNALEAAIKMLGDNGFSATGILTNIHDFVNLWRFSGFVRGVAPNAVVKVSSGRNIPIQDAPEVPEGITFVIDSAAAGALTVKGEATATITEISEEEKPEILKALPELTVENLKQKVRVHVEEEFRVDIRVPKAILTITKESN